MSDPTRFSAETATMSPVVVVLALALLLGLQPVTTDLYLPTLPALRTDLNAPMGGVQLTLSVLMMSFGLGQLLLGPVADRVGRRPVLLSGLLLYTAAALLAAMAPSITLVVLCRAVQGLGLAAAVVCARAMLRDLYEPQQGARIMAKAMSGLGLIAMLSPALGGLIAAAWGWRAAMLALACFSACALVFVAARVPETLRQRNPHATQMRPLLAAWRHIALHRSFVAYGLMNSLSYGALYTFLAGSSFIYIGVLGSSRQSYGLLVGICAGTYMLGTFWCRHLLRNKTLPETIGLGAFFTLAGAVLMAAIAFGAPATPLTITIAQCLFIFGHGVLQPCGQAGVVGPFPRHAGAASALSGFAIAATAFAVGAWLSLALDQSIAPWALTHAFLALLCALTAWTLVQRLDRAVGSVIQSSPG